MQLVNPITAYPIGEKIENINGVGLRGIPEKQGWSFSRHGWLAALEDQTIDADKYGAMIRKSLRPLSKPTLEKARLEYARREVVRYPRYFIIEPNASCNRKCVFCPIIVTNRKGNMKWDAFSRLMAECGEHDVYGISLYQLSEPMLYRGTDSPGDRVDIADMVNAAKKTGGFRAVNISTNGDAGNLSRLLECDLDDLFISIDGTTADVYDANRPSTTANDTCAFDRTIGRVMAFLEEKARIGSPKPWVRLQIINKDNTAPQVLDFIRHWIQIPGVDDVLVKHLDAMNPWLGNSVVPESESQAKRDRVASMACQHLWAIGSVVADGRYNACCHDSRTELTTAGANIYDMKFADWWSGEWMNALRAEHSGGHFRQPCATCLERDPWLG